MPDLIKGTVIDAVTTALAGYGSTQELTPSEFEEMVEIAVAAIDSVHYTVNPNSPVHPSTPRN